MATQLHREYWSSHYFLSAMVQVTELPVSTRPSEEGAGTQISYDTFTLCNTCRSRITLRILPFPWNTLCLSRVRLSIPSLKLQNAPNSEAF